MDAYLEVWGLDGSRLLPLGNGEVSVGRDRQSDLSVLDDPQVSRSHAMLVSTASGWCVRDLNSSNGTFVNGQRLTTDRPLRAGDEIRVGQTRMVYRPDRDAANRARAVGPANPLNLGPESPLNPAPEGSSNPGSDSALTIGPDRPPDLTDRERDVLTALVGRATRGELFHEPASTEDLAVALGLSESTVKSHLLNLYTKFEIFGEAERSRVRLANAALRRGAINLADFGRVP